MNLILSEFLNFALDRGITVPQYFGNFNNTQHCTCLVKSNQYVFFILYFRLHKYKILLSLNKIIKKR